jgi:capsular exopolysaccharide synthesis family protein
MNDKLQKLSQALAPPGPAEAAASSGEVTVPFQRLASEEPESHGEFSLRDYWRTIHRRRWTILATAALAGVLAAVYNYIQVPTYQAKATIQIDREEPDISRLDDKYAQIAEQPDYIETQYKILRSRSLSKRVISKLGLTDRAEFQPEGEAIDLESAGEEAFSPVVIDLFLERLGVTPGKGTRLVDVSFESVDRELAPLVVNTLTEEYIEHNLEAKWNATQKASGWLQTQLSTLKANLEASESELHDYAAAHSILFVEERKDITTEKLAKLEDELTRAEADRIQKQSLAMLVEDSVQGGARLPGSLNSDAYREYQAKLAELRREHSQLLVTFAAEYPKVQRIERQIEEAERSLAAEKDRMLSSVRERFEIAERREELLSSAALAQRAAVNRLSGDFIQYNILKRDAETNRQLYEGLLQRLKEAGISAGLRASNISMLDPAEIPGQAYRPKKLRNLVLALTCGLLFGVGLAFVKEHLNTVVRTPDEVERMTGLAMLAVIPRSKQQFIQAVRTRGPASNKRSGNSPMAALTNGNGAGEAAAAANGFAPWAPEQGLSEAYRTLRSSVLLGWDESMRRILVTSSQPEEGKTSVSLNLACSLAQLGRQVLVVDADMRRPNCARQLGVQTETGLTDYLQGMSDLDQVIVSTKIEGLSLVPAGRSSLVASDLLYSPRLSTLLREAGRRFQHVVVDSPPSLVLSDARTISRLVEGVILVVSDATERGSLLRTKQTFDEAGVHFLGFVMNRVDLNNLDYGYYRDYGYYYSYSDRDA